MKLGIAAFTCLCGHLFEAPQLPPELYGTFLLRSAAGSMAILNATEDTTYEEALALIKSSPRSSSLKASDHGIALQDIYGELACDAGPDGAFFSIGMPPRCPACGTQHIVSWAFKSPPVITDVEMPSVTHQRWNTLTPAEKQSDADRLLASRKPWTYVRA